jgi:hypothetical protein
MGKRTGSLDVLGSIYAGGWELVEDVSVVPSDSYTKLLLHGDGLDGAGAFPDASPSAKSLGANGNVQVDTAQYKFGGSSILMDGNGDFLKSADDADWYFGTGNFVIDFQVRWRSLPTVGNSQTIITQFVDTSNGWSLYLANIGGTYTWCFDVDTGGTTLISTRQATTIATDTWYHVALVRSGNNFYFFQEGQQIGSTVVSSSAIENYAGYLYIGQRGNSTWYFNGWLDEIRISKGTDRGWTANFTAPTAAYTGDVPLSTYTFSNLHGDTDEEYRIVCFLKNASSSASYFGIRPNNVQSTVYGRQYLNANNTTASAARATATYMPLNVTAINQNYILFSDMVLKARSGIVRTALVRSANGISGTTVTEASLMGDSWNNTADEITSLVVYGSAVRGIGQGSRMLLFKRNLLGSEATTGKRYGSVDVKGALNAGVMQRIFSATLSEAATSIDVPNLDGDTDVLYEIIARPVHVTGTPGTNMIFNSDVGDTYGVQQIYGLETTAGASRSTTGTNCVQMGDISTAGSVALIRALVFAPTKNVRVVLRESLERATSTTVMVLRFTGATWNNTADNLTDILYRADVAGGLGIGTRLEVWALRKKS